MKASRECRAIGWSILLVALACHVTAVHKAMGEASRVWFWVDVGVAAVTMVVVFVVIEALWEIYSGRWGW